MEPTRLSGFQWCLCRRYAVRHLRGNTRYFGCVPYGLSGSGSVIRDHSDHSRSNEPMNPLWTRIHRIIWSTMIQMISDLGSLILIRIISKERTLRLLILLTMTKKLTRYYKETFPKTKFLVFSFFKNKLSMNSYNSALAHPHVWPLFTVLLET